MKAKGKPLRVIYDGKKPSAVILDIPDYEKLLKAIDDCEGLRFLAKLKKRSGHVIPLAEYLARQDAR